MPYHASPPQTTPLPTRRRTGLALWLVAVVAALAVAAPAVTLAATQTMVPACDGVNLRSGTTTSATIKARLTTGATVTVVGTVSGGAWSTTCPTAKSGSGWYKVSAVNGKSVSSLYGISYIYAATGVLKAAPAPATSTTDAFGTELMRLVNLDRKALGKPAYLVDPRLAEIARNAAFTCPTNASMQLRGRSRDMADRGYFSHTVPGCYVAGTTTPYSSLTILRTVFGYSLARGEIIEWNAYGSYASTYKIGCDVNGANCVGGTTTTPFTVGLAQRDFMGSSVHRAVELNAYQRFGCGSATVPGTIKTYYTCLFADGGPAISPSPTPSPSPAGTAMVPACAGVNLRSSTSTSATVKAQLGTGATVTVIGTVSGGSWGTYCPGWKSGSSWYRVSAVNGKSTSSLYGVSYVYAATGVLAAAPAGTTTATAGMIAPGWTITFYGRGYGHGVGLSQYGARGRAIAGQTATQILAHYYAGTTQGTIATTTQIRVLLLDDFTGTQAAPLTVIGRGGSWGIKGQAATFPADARIRVLPAATGATPAWRMIVDDASGKVLLDAAAPADLRLEPREAGTTLQLLSKASTYDLYRGVLRLVLAATSADVVNELPMEDYLRGVVPAEMPSSWPVEARTAQTIAARSYAAYRLRPGTSTFDVYDDTRSQVYGGVRRETPEADAVITSTAGKVLLSGGAVVNALFHSTGGGATENNENVFVSSTGARVAGPVSYLRGSADRDAAGVPYDAAAPYATWRTAGYSTDVLSVILGTDARTNVGTLVSLDLHDRGVSGRLVSVTLVGSSGTRTVSGSVFTDVFNAGRPAADPPMRSTLLDIAPIP